MQHLELLPPGTPVILAKGLFPDSRKALDYLYQAEVIICCDGAAQALKAHDLIPEVVIGDLDSLNSRDKQFFADRLVHISEQETNDLTKAIRWAAQNRYEQLVILGADGGRLDHTIGNASLLAEHCELASMMMVTDQGTLIALSEPSRFDCHTGQQISIFPMTPGMSFTSNGLKYPLKNSPLDRWWQGTLNEALGTEFTLGFSPGKVLVYLND